MESVQPIPTIVVIGAGHVGQAVVHLAHWLGFHVIVSDDRPEFATPDAAPNADKYLLGTISELANSIEITPHTYLVLATRNSGLDVDGLPALLDSQAAYIGVIGSERRWQTTRKNLKEQGVSKKKLDAVVSPMGIEINAETPEEIAVSILSEIIMLRRGGDGKRMKS